MLLDRVQECEQIEQLLGALRGGLSGTFVLRGEAGIGKTMLLEHAMEGAVDLRVARVLGVESETDLDFAGLHQLLMPFLDLVEQLPPPQRGALTVAFGLDAGPPSNRFLVGLATLTLLAAAARERPLLCVVDDAQWLDVESAAVITFVARRLLAEAVGLVFAVREPLPDRTVFDGLPTMLIKSLPDDAARELLTSVVGGKLTESVVDRVLSDTERNPLAIVELGRGRTRDELEAQAWSPVPLPISGRLEAHFARQVREMPSATRTMLSLAAAEPSAAPSKLWQAGQTLGIDIDAAAEEAKDAGLLLLAPEVRFRHPSIRSAVYRGLSVGERRRVHTALADASDRHGDEDRRARHLAAAAMEPDEAVAAELERAAERAGGKGGYAARASLLRRAVELTPDDTRRATRALSLAEAELIAGNVSAAREVVDQALPGLNEDRLRGTAMRLDGAILFAAGMATEASEVLASAASILAPHESAARETLLEAFEASVYAGPVEWRRVIDVAGSFPPAEGEPAVADLLFEGFGARFTAGYEHGVAPLRAAIRALCSDELDPGKGIRWYGLGCLAAGSIWDHQALLDLSTRWVRTARMLGALTPLPLALAFRGFCDLLAGRFDDADGRDDEAGEIAAATGNPGLSATSGGDSLSLAFRGRVDEARATAVAMMNEAAAHGQRGMVRYGHYILVRAEMSGRQYDAALAAAVAATEDDVVYATEMALPELVEAAVRAGRRELALVACKTLSERAQAAGTQWGLGLAARARALVSDGADAEDAYREAIDHLGRTQALVDLARVHLLFGEWLRRAKRRTEARQELETAQVMFVGMGADGYAEHARAELVATGARARRRKPGTSLDLTPQEARIAEFVSEGASNKEIATLLFLSPATVDYHLRKVFVKLNVTSRTQLARRILDQGAMRAATAGGR